MDREPAHRRLRHLRSRAVGRRAFAGSKADDRGLATAASLASVAMVLVLVVMVVNGLVWQYADGAVRHAIEEGARIGARVDGDVEACERAAGFALDDLLGGPLGDDITVRCRVRGPVIEAEATVRLPGWLPTIGDLRTVRAAVHRLEPIP